MEMRWFLCEGVGWREGYVKSLAANAEGKSQSIAIKATFFCTGYH